MVKENITARFCELSHLAPDEAASYSALISSAEACFIRLLNRDPEGDEIPLCEYAAACKAFYDYAVLIAASEKTYSSKTGGLFAKTSDSGTVKFAENLWQQSLAALPAGLITDGGFVFEGVAG